MRKLILGVLVAATALGASAFTNAKTALNKRFAVSYYQHSSGLYTKVVPSDQCSVHSITPCTISYTTDPGVTSFTYAGRPSGGVDSPDKAKGSN